MEFPFSSTRQETTNLHKEITHLPNYSISKSVASLVLSQNKAVKITFTALFYIYEPIAGFQTTYIECVAL